MTPWRIRTRLVQGPPGPPGPPDNRVDVKTYGAKGDGSTDDTANILRAVAAVKALSILNPFGAVRAPRLYFSPGTYLVSDVIELTLLQGVIVEGDGFLQSTIIGTAGANSKRAILSLVDCQTCSVQNIAILANGGTATTITAAASAGDTTVYITSTAGISVGQSIGLRRNNVAESLIVLTTGSDGGGPYITCAAIANAYAIGDQIGPGPFPATLTAAVSAGATKIYVTSAAKLTGTITLARKMNNFSEEVVVTGIGSGTITCAALKYPYSVNDLAIIAPRVGLEFRNDKTLAGYFPSTQNRTVNVAIGGYGSYTMLFHHATTCETVSGTSDVNNELHRHFGMRSIGQAEIASVSVGHYNSISSEFYGPEMASWSWGGQTLAGGTYRVFGGGLGGQAFDHDLGAANPYGGFAHALEVHGTYKEAGGGFIHAAPGASCAQLIFKAFGHYQKSGPNNVRSIDVTGASTTVILSGCTLNGGASFNDGQIYLNENGAGSSKIVAGGSPLWVGGITLVGNASFEDTGGNSWPNANLGDGPTITAGGVYKTGANGPVPVSIGDADATLACAAASSGTYKAARFLVSPGTLTANRTMTLGTSGARTGEVLEIERRDSSANTIAVVNGGAGGGTVFTFAASLKGRLKIRYNGTDWGTPEVVAIT